jgi:DNA-binding MarR family transcriptional regulator
MIDRLERLGLLARAPHPSDRRKVVVSVTDEGTRRCHELIGPLVEEGGREVAAKYTTEQLALVIDYLRTNTALQRRHVERLRGQTRANRIEPSATGVRLRSR